MHLNKVNLRLFSLNSIFLITLNIASSINYPILAIAQSSNPVCKTSQQTQIRFISPQKDPPDRGTPPTNEGTGSRGDCLSKQNKPPLTRLVGSPVSKLTVNQRPTFWMYTPLTRQDAPFGEFSLQIGDNEVYRTRFELPIKPGIVSINLPPTAPSLTVNKSYRWYIDIQCPNSEKPQDSSTPASLTGEVQRVTLSPQLVNELNTAKTSLERIKIYAKYGIWYETLTQLAALRLNQPQNCTLNKVWVDLLSQPEIGLEKIAQEPIVGQVKLNEKVKNLRKPLTFHL